MQTYIGEWKWSNIRDKSLHWNTYIHSFIHTYIHTHIHACIHITHTYIHITHTYIHIHTYHTYMHTHTYIHITHTYTLTHSFKMWYWILIGIHTREIWYIYNQIWNKFHFYGQKVDKYFFFTWTKSWQVLFLHMDQKCLTSFHMNKMRKKEKRYKAQ